MENEYYEEDGVSLGQIFKVMFLRWKLLLIITASIFVVGLLGTQLIYNRMKTKYVSTIDYVNVVGETDGTYINNSIFNYRDIIKLDNLTKVKNSNESFSSIDVEKISKNEEITLTKTYDESSKLYTYSISIRTKFFKDSDQAKEFLYEVLNTPVSNLISIYETSDNKSYLSAYTDSNYYEIQIEALYNELNLIDNKYTELLKIYPESSIEGKNVSEYQVLFQNKYGQTVEKNNENNKTVVKYKVIEDLKNELSANNYVKDFDKNEAALLNEKAALQKQYDENEALIAAQEGRIEKYNGSLIIDNSKSSEALVPFTTEISKLTAENEKIQFEIDVIDAKIAAQGGSQAEITAFETKLNNLYNSLATSANEYTNVSSNVVKNYSKTEYVNKAIESTGGLGLIISALLSLIAGLVVACVVNLIIDREKLQPGYFDKENNSKKEEKVVENKEE